MNKLTDQEYYEMDNELNATTRSKANFRYVIGRAAIRFGVPFPEVAGGYKDWREREQRKRAQEHKEPLKEAPKPFHFQTKGIECWKYDGEYHRADGPAWIETASDSLCQTSPECRGKALTKWYKNGKLHNDNGPAVIDYWGNKEWWVNGIFQKLETA